MSFFIDTHHKIVSNCHWLA